MPFQSACVIVYGEKRGHIGNRDQRDTNHAVDFTSWKARNPFKHLARRRRQLGRRPCSYHQRETRNEIGGSKLKRVNQRWRLEQIMLRTQWLLFIAKFAAVECGFSLAKRVEG